MRRASFMHTQAQMRTGAAAARASAVGVSYAGKCVTRRIGWRWCREGDYLLAVAKSQGIKRGETVEIFGVVQVTSIRREPLHCVTIADCIREGFPELSPAEFQEMFRAHMVCAYDAEVARVVFRHVDVRRIRSAREGLTERQQRAMLSRDRMTA